MLTQDAKRLGIHPSQQVKPEVVEDKEETKKPTKKKKPKA